MAKLTKKQKEANEKFDKDSVYPLDEAIKIVKDITSTNFDSSVDVSVRLGVDPRKANQMVIVLKFRNNLESGGSQGRIVLNLNA